MTGNNRTILHLDIVPFTFLHLYKALFLSSSHHNHVSFQRRNKLNLPKTMPNKISSWTPSLRNISVMQEIGSFKLRKKQVFRAKTMSLSCLTHSRSEYPPLELWKQKQIVTISTANIPVTKRRKRYQQKVLSSSTSSLTALRKQ